MTELAAKFPVKFLYILVILLNSLTRFVRFQDETTWLDGSTSAISTRTLSPPQMALSGPKSSLPSPTFFRSSRTTPKLCKLSVRLKVERGWSALVEVVGIGDAGRFLEVKFPLGLWKKDILFFRGDSSVRSGVSGVGREWQLRCAQH